MQNEISSGSMLGIVLIALAAIIGLGFGVFAIAKGTANEGVTNVQESLDAVSQQAYTDYDQKIVSGTQVISAYQNFTGKNTAILIMTQAQKDKAVNKENATTGIPSGSGVDAAYKDGTKIQSFMVEAFQAGTVTAGVTSYVPYKGVKTSTNQNVANPAFVNYNALLGKDTGGPAKQYTSGKWIYFDNNCWRTTATFEADAGKVQFNNISMNLTKSGMMEYVPTSARFQANLIKDTSGTIMGVAFEQITTT